MTQGRVLFSIRLDRSVAQQIEEIAATEERSCNAVISRLIRRALAEPTINPQSPHTLPTLVGKD